MLIKVLKTSKVKRPDYPYILRVTTGRHLLWNGDTYFELKEGEFSPLESEDINLLLKPGEIAYVEKPYLPGYSSVAPVSHVHFTASPEQRFYAYLQIDPSKALVLARQYVNQCGIDPSIEGDRTEWEKRVSYARKLTEDKKAHNAGKAVLSGYNEDEIILPF